METVNGKRSDVNIKIYTLSTCGWCNKVKNLLKELDVSYSFIDVDLLDFDEKAKVKEELKTYNPRLSYPTIVINNTTIVGFDREKIVAEIK